MPISRQVVMRWLRMISSRNGSVVMPLPAGTVELMPFVLSDRDDEVAVVVHARARAGRQERRGVDLPDDGWAGDLGAGAEVVAVVDGGLDRSVLDAERDRAARDGLGPAASCQPRQL